MTTAQGIDISRWNAPIDPSRPHDFVIAKASEGSSWRDTYFQTAASMGFHVFGAYHYYRSGVPWRQQADNFLNSVSGFQVDFLALDYEYINNTLDKKTDAELHAFYKHLESKGRKVLVYTSWGEYNSMISRGSSWIRSAELWVARWFERSAYLRASGPGVPNWRFWQYGGDYKDKSGWEVPGTGEGAAYGVGSYSVDLNKYNGTRADLWSWLGKSPVEDNEAPEPTTGGGLTGWQLIYNKFRVLPRR